MPYKNLNFLYTEQQITTTTFTNECTGVLSIEQLLQGKPHWENVGKGVKKVKKTLIISEIPHDDLGFEWYEVLKCLLNDGFNIYVTANNQLIKIDHINQIHGKLISLIKVLYKYELANLLNTIHLKMDQILVIEKWHWSLLKNSEQISDEEILNEKYINGISEYFDDSHLECNLKFISENVIFSQMIGRFLEYYIKTTKKLNISVKSLAWKFLLNNPKYISIIQKIEKLYIHDLQTENHITELLTIVQKINTLKSLGFFGCENLNNFFQLTNPELYRNITSLKITDCRDTNLTKILQNAENLCRLRIIESEIFLDSINEDFFNLQLLQFIDKRNLQLSDNNTSCLRTIFKNAINIKKIQIITNYTIDTNAIIDYNQKNYKIEILEGLSLQGDISPILNNNLRSLHLSELSPILNNNLRSLHLSELSTIPESITHIRQNISCLTINLDSFNEIFITSLSNIKNLVLNNVEDLQNIATKNFPWHNLESISISLKHKIDIDHGPHIECLNKILIKTTNCREIILEKFNFANNTPALIIPHDILSITFNDCNFEKIDLITEKNMIYNLTIKNCIFLLKNQPTNVSASTNFSESAAINVNILNIESCKISITCLEEKFDELFLSKLQNLEEINFSFDINSETALEFYTVLHLIINTKIKKISKIIEENGVLNHYRLLYNNIKEIAALQHTSSTLDVNVDSMITPTLEVKKIFTHMKSSEINNTINNPTTYRLNIYENADFEDDQGNAAILFYNQEDPNLEDIPKFIINGDVDCYKAKLQITNIKNWQALPSLSKDEYLEPDSIKIYPKTNYELKYSSSLNQYFIKFEKSGKFDIEYMVLVSQNKVNDVKTTFPKEIADLIQKYQEYGATGSFTNEDYNSGESFINAICTKNFGPCRTRVLGFVHELSKKSDIIRFRIIVNHCHTFVELLVNNAWVTVDLGGWPVKLNVKNAIKEEYDNNNILEEIFKNEINPNFVTWNINNKHVENKKTYNKYIEHLSNINGKRIFIQMDSSNNSILNLVYNLYINTNNKRPLYYIHKADQLICSAPFMTISSNNQGKINKGPGGNLYDFLNKNHDLNPIIVINCNNFNQNEIASNVKDLELNKIDGQTIPKNTLILLLSDTESLTTKSILSSISHDRIDLNSEITPCLTSNVLEYDAQQKNHSLESSNSALKEISIELYNSNNWYQILVGEWLTEEKRLKFKKGKLLEAIENNIEQINLINAPWNLLEFEMFWQQALQEKCIIAYGITIILPPNIKIYKQTKEYNHIFSIITLEKNTLLDLPILPLNSYTVNQFFKRYTAKDGELLNQPGFIEKYKKGICIYKTENISADDLARIKAEADKNDVKIHFITHAINYDIKKSNYVSANIYVSNNIETSVQKLKSLTEYADAQVIDISGIKDLSLINIIDAHLDIEKNALLMSQETGILLEELQNGRKVILKGNFNARLINILSPFLIPNTPKSEHYKYASNLTLVADSNEYLNLINYFMINEQEQINEQKYHEKSMLCDMDVSAEDLIRQRLKLISNALVKEKYVFIAGPTGCGKTEFINNLPKYMKDFKEELLELDYEVHTDIKKWTESKSCSIKHILFLDEANLTGDIHSHSWIENLYNQEEPFVIYKGRKINVTKNHFVIMAGNLADDIYYTGERVTPYIFKRPNIIVFKPLSKYFIAQILEKYQLERKDIQILLDVYQFVCKLSKEYIALTPRELRMIADLIKHAKYSVSKSVELIITNALNNQEHKINFKEWFNNQKYDRDPPDAVELKPNTKFQMTHTRNYYTKILIDFLKIRKQRSNGGLGGILFSGKCCGKTSLITYALEYLSYREININDLNNDSNILNFINAYIIVTPNMLHTQILDILKLAFTKGIVVVIKNINNYPMLEPILNDYLMGLNLDHTPSSVKGFSLICTTNPNIKTPMSLALLHRLIKIELPEYNNLELDSILNFIVNHKNLSVTDKDIYKLLSEFEIAQTYANKNSYPEPDLRVLISALENQFLPNDSQQSDSKRINMRDDDYIYGENVKHQNITTSPLLTFSERKKVANENHSMVAESLQGNNPNIVKNLDSGAKNIIISRFKRL